MQSRLLWVSLVPLLVVSISCSGSSDSHPGDAVEAAQAKDSAQTGDAAVASPESASAPQNVPVISGRSYVSGSAKTHVDGMFSIDEDIAINTQASFSDGTMTWLQYGASGAEAPNILVTVNKELQEVGINVGRGKSTSTVASEACKGGMEVTDKSITGHYSCPGATSYDPRTSAMGQVNIEVSFTAGS